MKQVSRHNRIKDDTVYTLVCDMNNIMKISSVNREMNSKGEEYGVVMTSLKIIGDLLKKKDFGYCIAAYDGIGSGVLRWKLYEDYKANRGKNYILHDPDTSDYMKKMYEFEKRVILNSRNKSHTAAQTEDEDESFERQKLILQSILEELCVRQYEFENVEGDDIIANYVKNRKPNEKIVIVSTDKDLTQLISDNVIVYSPKTKGFITVENSSSVLGITHENIALCKILCGDSSDNIKGIKGLGEQTMLKLFPDLRDNKSDIGSVVERAKEILTERKESKKKPLKVLENIVNSVTDGSQGDRIYEVNSRIIDLSEPLLTNEARAEMSTMSYAPMDITDRDVSNVYKIIRENGMVQMSDEGKFGNLLSPFYRIMMMERKRYEEFLHK